jgi:hypothetical protein
MRISIIDFPGLHKCPKHERPYTGAIDVVHGIGILVKYACGCCLTFVENIEPPKPKSRKVD